MNFYSDNIINDIIDNAPLETMIDDIADFKAQIKYMCIKYSAVSIGPEYTQGVISDDRTKYVFYCLDPVFCVANCPSIMAYRRVFDKETNTITYYMLFLCTKRRFKGQGYAGHLLNGFVDYIRGKEFGDAGENSDKTDVKECRNVNIRWSSVITAVTFYEERGFKWTRKNLTDYPFLMRYEAFMEGKEYFMMELSVKPL
jgi:GNAT superfamily N-acetyltransferase